MKKLSLCFLAIFTPIAVVMADGNSCYGPESGDFEFSQCAFLGQTGLTSTVKSFWGNPQISGSEPLSGDNGADEFILRRAWQCGICETQYDKWSKTTGSNLFQEQCSKTNADKADDQAIMAYVATDVSNHGARFCLTQFSAASWAAPKFYVYHQIPKSGVEQSFLECAWFCEPGYDGDRCETRGVPDYLNPLGAQDLSKKSKELKSATVSAVFEESECPTCSSAVGRTVVLDYKKLGEREQPGKWKTPAYQQEIVIGATAFLEHGIKARPMLLGAYGGHHECYDHSKDTKQTEDRYNDFGGRKYLDYVGTKLFAATAGGKERVLCLQGYTKDANCNEYEGAVPGSEVICSGHKSIKYDSNKYLRLYDYNNNCIYYGCRNGMHLYSEDNYACSMCKNTAREGFCQPSGGSKKCLICNVGECIDMATCTCNVCSSVLTKEQMKFGKDKMSKCWDIADTESFRQCVTGDYPEEE